MLRDIILPQSDVKPSGNIYRTGKELSGAAAFVFGWFLIFRFWFWPFLCLPLRLSQIQCLRNPASLRHLFVIFCKIMHLKVGIKNSLAPSSAPSSPTSWSNNRARCAGAKDEWTEHMHALPVLFIVIPPSFTCVPHKNTTFALQIVSVKLTKSWRDETGRCLLL